MTLPTAQDRFDSGGRYLLKLQPAELIRWRLQGDVVYRAWLDTCTIPFPGSPQRICDTVCQCEEANGQPWATPIESQTQLDPDMFGRVLGSLGQLSVEKRPDPEPGSRFHVAAIVFGSVPEEIQQRIKAINDPDRLEAAVRQVSRLGSLDELTL